MGAEEKKQDDGFELCEESYRRGKTMQLVLTMKFFAHELFGADEYREADFLIRMSEYEEARMKLHELCQDLGVEVDRDLHMVDVIEKHLRPELVDD